MTLEVLRNNRNNMDLLKDKFKGLKALKMKKVFNKIDEELNTLESFRNDLVLKYGEEDEVGNITVKENTENWMNFSQEFFEALKADVELNVDFSLNENELEEFTLRELEFLEALGVELKDV